VDDIMAFDDEFAIQELEVRLPTSPDAQIGSGGSGGGSGGSGSGGGSGGSGSGGSGSGGSGSGGGSGT
jgi:hypothetical protein